MAKGRHMAEQIIIKLREVEVILAQGLPLAKVVRELGITEQPCYSIGSRNLRPGLAIRSQVWP